MVRKLKCFCFFTVVMMTGSQAMASPYWLDMFPFLSFIFYSRMSFNFDQPPPTELTLVTQRLPQDDTMPPPMLRPQTDPQGDDMPPFQLPPPVGSFNPPPISAPTPGGNSLNGSRPFMPLFGG